MPSEKQDSTPGAGPTLESIVADVRAFCKGRLYGDKASKIIEGVLRWVAPHFPADGVARRLDQMIERLEDDFVRDRRMQALRLVDGFCNPPAGQTLRMSATQLARALRETDAGFCSDRDPTLPIDADWLAPLLESRHGVEHKLAQLMVERQLDALGFTVDLNADATDEISRIRKSLVRDAADAEARAVKRRGPRT